MEGEGREGEGKGGGREGGGREGNILDPPSSEKLAPPLVTTLSIDDTKRTERVAAHLPPLLKFQNKTV